MKQDKMTKKQCELVINHLGLVHKVIRSSIRGFYDYEELYACGCEFLCLAAIKYDIRRTKGSFVSFAYVVIKNGIIHYLKKEGRFKQRDNDYMFLKANSDKLDEILENVTISNAYLRLIGGVSQVPLKRGLKILFEHVVNDKSLEELAEKYGVSRNTAYLNMYLAKRYIRQQPIKEKKLFLEEDHHLLKEESKNE